jgi:hypothetical protein
VLTFDVEYLVKGFTGEQVEVVTPEGSAQCGLNPPRGKRIGLLLTRVGDHYESSICQQVDAEALFEAIPEVNERPPLAVLGGSALAGLLLFAFALWIGRRKQQRRRLG